MLTRKERDALHACSARIGDGTASVADYDAYANLTEIAAGNPAAAGLVLAAA